MFLRQGEGVYKTRSRWPSACPSVGLYLRPHHLNVAITGSYLNIFADTHVVKGVTCGGEWIDEI